MIEVLNQFLDTPTIGCVMGNWLLKQDNDVQELFAQLKEKEGIVLVELYTALLNSTDLPFKLTTFRSHMRGVCTCPKI